MNMNWIDENGTPLSERYCRMAHGKMIEKDTSTF